MHKRILLYLVIAAGFVPAVVAQSSNASSNGQANGQGSSASSGRRSEGQVLVDQLFDPGKALDLNYDPTDAKGFTLSREGEVLKGSNFAHCTLARAG